MKRFSSMMSPAALIIVFQMIILVATGILATYVGYNFQSNKEVLLHLNETATGIDNLLQSGNRTSNIVMQIQEVAEEAEESRRNQTERLLPLFFASFEQTERIDSLMQNLTDLLAQQRFTEKEIRDTQVAIAFDLNQVANVTESLRDLVGFLRANFNETGAG